MTGCARRGYDAGKKINETRRHLAVDVLGLLLSVLVTAAYPPQHYCRVRKRPPWRYAAEALGDTVSLAVRLRAEEARPINAVTGRGSLPRMA